MAIVFCVADGLGGNGDFMFALKMASELRKEFREKGLYNEDIVIVTEQSGKNKIEALGGDKEFNISVINHEKYKKKVASGELSVDYFLAGPVFNPFLNTPTGLKVPPI